MLSIPQELMLNPVHLHAALDTSSFSFRNRVDSSDATTTRTSQIYTFNKAKHLVLHERFFNFINLTIVLVLSK